MLRITAIALVLAASMLQTGCAHQRSNAGASSMSDHDQAIARSLDQFHAAASRADFDAYFGAFTSDGVFLGTDATERWTVEEFKAYCKPYFDQGKGWTYLPRERHICVDASGTGAWVDEVLENEKYGMCRGTAYLVRDQAGAWKVARYSLAFLIPNDVAAEATGLGKK
jgi:ketosteroid isomerase-like protein